MAMLINQMAISEEERKLSMNRTKNILAIYRRGTITKEEINRMFGEWMEIANRIQKGAMTIDSANVRRERSKQHLKELEDLYRLLLKMLGMYEMVFQRVFADTPERFERAQRKILDILLPPAEKQKE